jgi:taurine dioxygenase
MNAQALRVEPLGGVIGAEITGVDLAAPLSAGVLDEIKAALWRHLVLFFPAQHLTPEQQCAFTRNFGALVRPAAMPSVDGFPDVTLVVREAGAPQAQTNFGGVWHSDQSFREFPAAGFTLSAVELPPAGGDTMFANLYAAYETLSDGMRGLLDPLIAVHGAGALDDPEGGYHDPLDVLKKHAVFPDVEHPLIRVHPETGRKLLYVSGSWIERFRDMTAHESRPLLDFLNHHAVRPEFTCRYRWTPGALALLDNRCTQHFAINDYPGYRRVMHRVMFAGERPQGP